MWRYRNLLTTASHGRQMRYARVYIVVWQVSRWQMLIYTVCDNNISPLSGSEIWNQFQQGWLRHLLQGKRVTGVICTKVNFGWSHLHKCDSTCKHYRHETAHKVCDHTKQQLTLLNGEAGPLKTVPLMAFRSRMQDNSHCFGLTLGWHKKPKKSRRKNISLHPKVVCIIKNHSRHSIGL